MTKCLPLLAAGIWLLLLLQVMAASPSVIKVSTAAAPRVVAKSTMQPAASFSVCITLQQRPYCFEISCSQLLKKHDFAIDTLVLICHRFCFARLTAGSLMPDSSHAYVHPLLLPDNVA